MKQNSDGEHGKEQPFLTTHPAMHTKEDECQSKTLTHYLCVEDKVLQGEKVYEQEQEVSVCIFANHITHSNIHSCALYQLYGIKRIEHHFRKDIHQRP